MKSVFRIQSPSWFRKFCLEDSLFVTVKSQSILWPRLRLPCYPMIFQMKYMSVKSGKKEQEIPFLKCSFFEWQEIKLYILAEHPRRNLQDSASVLLKKSKSASLTNTLTFRSFIKVRIISQFSSDLTQGLHDYFLIPECTNHPTH